MRGGKSACNHDGLSAHIESGSMYSVTSDPTSALMQPVILATNFTTAGRTGQHTNSGLITESGVVLNIHQSPTTAFLILSGICNMNIITQRQTQTSAMLYL